MILRSDNEILARMDLPPELLSTLADASPSDDVGTDLPTLEAAEKEQIVRTLLAAQGNMSMAARNLGIARSTLYLKLRRYGLDDGSIDSLRVRRR